MQVSDEEPTFTLVFRGDITALPFNPLKTETCFGVPVAAGVGDALTAYSNLLEAVETIHEAAKVIVGDNP